jgi:hypothetical protein
MLNDLLNAFDSGEIISLRELAATQRSSVAIVRAELDYLEHRGYIKKVCAPPSCPKKSCNGCKGCASVLSLPLMWEKREAVK